MNNPFAYGTVVTGDDFADRERELRDLTGKLKETVRIFLAAPRRYGKTSLIRNSLGILQKRGLLTSYVDLYWATSSKDFMELYAGNAIRGSRSIARKAAHFIRDYLPRIRPSLGFDPSGNPMLSMDFSGAPPIDAAKEVFDLPEKIAHAQKKRFVVVLDEFQEIVKLDGGVLEKQLRAAIQHHTEVSYLFAGSKSHMLIDMVSEQGRPFYQMGTVMPLDKIPQDEFSPFIKDKFEKSGRKISPAALNRIFEEAENVPHYVQLLSFYLWDHCRGVSLLNEEHVGEALSTLLGGQEPAYLTIWEGLTLHQRKTARAAALLRGRMITSKEAIQRFQLESASNATKSLRALCAKGILRKEKGGYVFEDVLFCRWIERINR
jgi:uncharacterized protein